MSSVICMMKVLGIKRSKKKKVRVVTSRKNLDVIKLLLLECCPSDVKL